MIDTNHEYAIIVDKDDNVLEYRKRGDLTWTDRIRVSGIWVENSKGKVLIAQRSKEKFLHPGLWGPAAAGGVEKGESYEENAYKELAEEIGVTGVTLKHVETKAVDQEDGTRRMSAWFKAIVDRDVDSLQLEDAVAQVKWVSKAWLKKDLRDNHANYVPSAHQAWNRLFLG